jgi:predicted alpha/beta-hydrolase family hydrolase
MDALDVDTPHGLARAHVHAAPGTPWGALVLGHGAGGSVGARDLVTATTAAREAGLHVALVEQPYRVAGKKAPPAAPRLDAAWLAVVAALRAGPLADLPLITGGRSSGARVACRTAGETAAIAVLCLAFPLQPPRRRAAVADPATRQAELDAVAVPVLVVQGGRDPFGMPPPGPRRTVVAVAGDHGLKSDLPAVAAAVAGWLAEVRP